MKAFYNALGNNFIATLVNFTVWFALTFFVYLETKSVFATGIIAGIYLTLTALSGFWFGSLVDHYRKKHAMLASSIFSLVVYAAGLAVYLMAPEGAYQDVGSIYLWSTVLLLMVGVVAGNIRNIALPTLVTMLIPEDRRDKANGLVGMTAGIGFGVVSVISGFLVGHSGLYWVLILATIIMMLAIIHLLSIAIPENKIVQAEGTPKKIDIKGTVLVMLAVPGLLALVFFSTFNNFLGGVFMALMDAYALELVSVQLWGILLGVLSFSFMLGGFLIAKFGLGAHPLRTMLLANLAAWVVCIFFTIQPSIVLFVAGCFVYMVIAPYIEAAEHTVIQKVVPLERQGRVFGFAQSVEQMASPLTAFLIGPLTQFIFIPLMTTGAGADLVGSWFGTGTDRGIALVFMAAGVIGIVAALLALRSKQYRLLSAKYAEG